LQDNDLDEDEQALARNLIDVDYDALEASI
jgi:hypothetical protein